MWKKASAIIATTGLLAYGATMLGDVATEPVLLTEENNMVKVRDNVMLKEQEYYQLNDEYEQVKKGEISKYSTEYPEFVSEVHVYDGPQGKGYQVLYSKEVTDTNDKTGTTSKRVITKSIGFGNEAVLRTWDWQ